MALNLHSNPHGNRVRVVMMVLLLALFWRGNGRAENIAASLRDPEGEELAEQLRSSAPEKASEVHGWLKTVSRRQKITNEVPVVCLIVPKTDYWDAVYETTAISGQPAQRLVVRHFPDKPNEYFAAAAKTAQAAFSEPVSLKPGEADIALGGSDFTLTDLGLDFLHWPQQHRIKDAKNSMRLGQSCYILESINPAGKDVVRVRSWIDRDSADQGAPGILVAEAYDDKGKKIKEFTLSGSSFKKVNGQWQLQKMTIENIPNKSETVLKFDLSKPNQP